MPAEKIGDAWAATVWEADVWADPGTVWFLTDTGSSAQADGVGEATVTVTVVQTPATEFTATAVGVGTSSVTMVKIGVVELSVLAAGAGMALIFTADAKVSPPAVHRPGFGRVTTGAVL